jgi:hypothetical protein
MNTVSLANPLNLLASTKGKFAKVHYTNLKGITKCYTVRTGVHKHLKGGNKYPCPNSITVFSMKNDNKGYKTFKEEGIQSIKCGSIIWNR